MSATPTDITSLDAAQQFAQYLAFKPLPKPQPAVDELAKLAESHARKAAAALSTAVENEWEPDAEPSEEDMMRPLHDAYEEFKADAEQLRQKLAAASPRDQEAEQKRKEAEAQTEK